MNRDIWGVMGRIGGLCSGVLSVVRGFGPRRRQKCFVEARFTKPRPECPHPELWHAWDDQTTETEVTVLVAAMVTALQPEFVVETGACLGYTTQAIGRALRENGHGKAVSLEVDRMRAATARRRCRGLPVSIIEMSSTEYVPSERIDFAFFDSLARLRAAEFKRYLPWMHNRTVVGFHDTGSHHPVRHFLLPLEQAGYIRSPLYLPTPRGVMFALVSV